MTLYTRFEFDNSSIHGKPDYEQFFNEITYGYQYTRSDAESLFEMALRSRNIIVPKQELSMEDIHDIWFCDCNDSFNELISKRAA